MAKSYYAILGISPDASTSEVKNAYRRLAKQYHPDHEGGDSRKFRDIQEAYCVLADAEKRRQYEQHGAGEPVRVRVVRPRYAREAEPLIPERGPFPRGRSRGRMRPASTFASSGLEEEDLFEWILRNFL